MVYKVSQNIKYLLKLFMDLTAFSQVPSGGKAERARLLGYVLGWREGRGSRRRSRCHARAERPPSRHAPVCALPSIVDVHAKRKRAKNSSDA